MEVGAYGGLERWFEQSATRADELEVHDNYESAAIRPDLPMPSGSSITHAPGPCADAKGKDPSAIIMAPRGYLQLYPPRAHHQSTQRTHAKERYLTPALIGCDNGGQAALRRDLEQAAGRAATSRRAVGVTSPDIGVARGFRPRRPVLSPVRITARRRALEGAQTAA
jgi:hypothetical protein